jgi:hypothetical protein
MTQRRVRAPFDGFREHEEPVQIYEHGDDVTNVSAARISPTGEVIVRVSDATTRAANIHLLDLGTRTLGAQLTTSGDIGGLDW